MTYQPAVYKEPGGNSLVVASSGTLTVQSGGTLTIDSGATVNNSATLTIASGGSLSVASGGTITAATGSNVKTYVETISTSADTLTAGGVSNVTGTTAGPTFLIANPVAGVAKYISLAGTTGATVRAIIAPASTGVSFGSSGQNQLTLSTTTLRGVTLVGISTAAYRVVGMHHVGDAGLGNVTT